jgi:hypothetical protein
VLHGRTGYGGTCAGASAPIFAEPSYLEPKIRSGNAVWSPETFAKFFVKRARCALVLIVGLLLSPRRRAPWLSCDGCSAVPRRWARHIRPGQSPLHHGTDAAWRCSRPGRGTGAATAPLGEPPFLCGESPLGVGRQCQAVLGARHRCAPLGLTWFGSGLAGRATRRVAVAGCSPCPRTIVHSPDRPLLATPLGWRCGLRGASRAHLWSAGRSRTCPVVLSCSWIAASQMMLRSAGHQGSDQVLAAFAALTDRDRSHQNFPLGPTGFP